MAALRTVIVGVDGSDTSRDALALGQMLAGPSGRLLVAHVHPFGPLSSLIGPGEYESVVRKTADSIFAHAREILDDATERELRLVSGRSPAEGLGTLAADAEAALVVVGSSARSRLERVLAGSVAEDLLSGAPVPVAVAPRGFADATRAVDAAVGCAYDGSPESEVALGLATKIAQALDAPLRVISVHGRLPFGGQVSVTALGYRSVNDAMREALQQRLSQATSAIPDGLHAEARLLDGDPAEALIGESETLDVLVAGSRGYGPVRAVLLGSVSRALVRGAACPVVVSPRPGDETNAGPDVA
jgi:nucleotide-binding universal stress UspA family protein